MDVDLERNKLTEVDAASPPGKVVRLVNSGCESDASGYMCLKCRGVGHLVKDCPHGWEEHYYNESWFFSAARKALDVPDFPEMINQPLCRRCNELELLKLLSQDISYEKIQDLEISEGLEQGYFRSLGKTGSIAFRQDCSLCRCLFGITSTPSSNGEDVIIIPTWKIFRLELRTSEESAYRSPSGRCLVSYLHPAPSSLSLARMLRYEDALCILDDDDLGPTDTVLDGRCVNTSEIDFDMVRKWLFNCRMCHSITCSPVWSEGLRDILLIDVRVRRLTQYPHGKCQYVALSYVWGPLERERFHLGPIRGDLPATIEDAITFTQGIGVRYLWVDSICIDQTNEAEKLRQIAFMSKIFGGAEATIIALSGESAMTGLPRMGSKAPMHPQLKCYVDGKRLIGLGPGVFHQSIMSPWALRAWTLQEEYLSSRCVYLSDHQMYFECKVMQCCETLDDSGLWARQVVQMPERRNTTRILSQEPGAATADPVGISPKTVDRLSLYADLAFIYSLREMSDQNDALHAFSGIAQHLSATVYSRGFFWGLPVEDMNWALLWDGRSTNVSRPGFPSWSWAGWRGGTWTDDTVDPGRQCYLGTHLAIWKVDSQTMPKQVIEIFRTPWPIKDVVDDAETLPDNHPLKRLINSASDKVEFDPFIVDLAASSSFLFVEGIVLHFTPKFGEPYIYRDGLADYVHYDQYEAGLDFTIRLQNRASIHYQPSQNARWLFLLLGREHLRDSSVMIYHFLVLVEDAGSQQVMRRKSKVAFLIPKDNQEVLNHLGMRKTRVVIA
jgi:Heterokaryon incompatibility protein (HET)